MGELTALAWILIAIALIAGVGVGSALRRPKTIVEDADAKKLEHLELTNARLEDELESKAADNKAWADSHQAVADELEETKEKLENATNPPELGEARAKVDELTVELERAREQAGKVEQGGLGQALVDQVAARAFVAVYLQCEAAHVANHHQDVLVDRVDVEQVELHQAGHCME